MLSGIRIIGFVFAIFFASDVSAQSQSMTLKPKHSILIIRSQIASVALSNIKETQRA